MGTNCSKVDKHTKQPIVENSSAEQTPSAKFLNENVLIKMRQDGSTDDANSIFNTGKNRSGTTLTTTTSNGYNRNFTDAKIQPCFYSPHNSGPSGDDDCFGQKIPSFAYKKGNLIGKGSFGEVYECLNWNTGELLAVKTIKITGDDSKIIKSIKSLEKKITQLKTLIHPNIVRYYGTEINEQNDEVDIIFEYVSAGSIKFLLDRFSRLHERVIALYTKQILEGLCYLHNNGIIHSNIKGSNVLIDANGIIKLTDFGCSKKLDHLTDQDNPQEDSFRQLPRSIQGSAYWMAPEVLIQQEPSMKGDIWSIGCVVIEMLTGMPPWVNITQDIQELMRILSRASSRFNSPLFTHSLKIPTGLPSLPNDISSNCRDFICKTMKFNPQERPSVMELLDHPFIKESPTIVADTSMSILSSQYTFDYGDPFMKRFGNVNPSQLGSNINCNTSFIIGGMNVLGTKSIVRERTNTQTFNCHGHNGGGILGTTGNILNTNPNPGKFYSHGNPVLRDELNSNHEPELCQTNSVPNIRILIAPKRNGMGNSLPYFSQNHSIPLSVSTDLRYQPPHGQVIEVVEEEAISCEKNMHNPNKLINILNNQEVFINDKRRKSSRISDMSDISTAIGKEEQDQQPQQKKDPELSKAEKRKKLEEQLKKQLEMNK